MEDENLFEIVLSARIAKNVEHAIVKLARSEIMSEHSYKAFVAIGMAKNEKEKELLVSATIRDITCRMDILANKVLDRIENDRENEN